MYAMTAQVHKSSLSEAFDNVICNTPLLGGRIYRTEWGEVDDWDVEGRVGSRLYAWV